MEKKKVFKMLISPVFLKMLFTNGCSKTRVIENKLPNDAIMIHQRFNVECQMIEFYFMSDTVGSDIIEGQSIESAQTVCLAFERIETIDKQRVEDAIKKYTHNGIIDSAKLLKEELGLE